jgi:hypothetical protein
MIDKRVSLLVPVQVAVKQHIYTNRLYMSAKLHSVVFAHTWVQIGSQIKNSLAEQN